MVVVVVMKLMIAGNTLFDFSLLLRHLPFGRELKAGLAHLAAIRAKRLPRLIKFRITFWVTTHTHTDKIFAREVFFPLLAAITPSSALKLNASKFALKHTHTRTSWNLLRQCWYGGATIRNFRFNFASPWRDLSSP